MNRYQTFNKVRTNLINSTLQVSSCVSQLHVIVHVPFAHDWGFKTEDTREKFVSLETVDRS